MEKFKKLLVPKVLIPVAIVLVLIVAYAIGCVFFSSHFLPNTVINDREYGGKSFEYVKEDIQSPLITEVTLIGKGNSEEVVDLSSVQCKEVVSLDELEMLKDQQNPYLWFMNIFQANKYHINSQMEYNEEELDRIISGLDIISGNDVVEPQNAQVVLGQSGYDIIPEVEGNTIDVTKLKEDIVHSMALRLAKIDLEESNIYIEPEITEESTKIGDVTSKLDKMLGMSITYEFGNRQEILDYDTIAEWIVLDKDDNLEIDEEKAKQYVEWLASKYDTIHTQRQFKTSNIGVISIGGGIYGWQTNIAKTTEELIEHILSGETKTIQPVYTSSAMHRGENDIGNTYIEIDLTKQHMWFYKNGGLFVDTPVVTGLPGTWRETPTGVYCIWSKETKRYLKGDDYKLWVEYWLPINWTGVGIHDATWQPQFGGETYLITGSHGCINTPRDICGQIFNNVEVLTPVIIYKS